MDSCREFSFVGVCRVDKLLERNFVLLGCLVTFTSSLWATCLIDLNGLDVHLAVGEGPRILLMLHVLHA